MNMLTGLENSPYGIEATHSRLDGSDINVGLPPIDSFGMGRTLNKGGGYSNLYFDPIVLEYIKYAKHTSGIVLDIGSGFGSASLELLNNSICNVIANDIGEENLFLLRKRAEVRHRSRLYLNSARFPQFLNLPLNTLSAVLISQVFHFLKGEEIELGLKKIYEWLIPGGKLFISTASPYNSNLLDFIAVYEERFSSGVTWPGHIEDFKVRVPPSNNLPDFFHVIDQRVMEKALERSGFEIELLTFIDRRKTMPLFHFDGRENIGVIAVKPVTPINCSNKEN